MENLDIVAYVMEILITFLPKFHWESFKRLSTYICTKILMKLCTILSYLLWRHLLIKYITAKTNQISKVDLLIISSFVHCSQIALFIFASIVSWVYLCRHPFYRLPLLKSITTGLMTSPINRSVFHWVHQLTLVSKDLKIHKLSLIMSILDWFTSYLSLIVNLCQTFKSCFSF